jgi:hypothetical protein
VTVVLGIVVLGVRVHRRDWIAIATVVLSVVVLAFTAGLPVAGASTFSHEGGLHLALAVTPVVVDIGGVSRPEVREVGTRLESIASAQQPMSPL